jgi:CheY-like chemotaxis protein
MPPAAPPPLRPLRILLVEDHGDTASALKWLLNSRGHDVETAGAVATAMQALARSEFDLLLSDLGLPDGSGLDIMRHLVAQGRDLPGIVISGFGHQQDITESRLAGFAAHITKPVLADQLSRTIATVMGAGSAISCHSELSSRPFAKNLLDK